MVEVFGFFLPMFLSLRCTMTETPGSKNQVLQLLIAACSPTAYVRGYIDACWTYLGLEVTDNMGTPPRYPFNKELIIYKYSA